VTRRIKATVTVAIPTPDGPARPVEAEAYLTREDSRWAATRQPGGTYWTLTHRGSGMGLSSILPPTKRSQQVNTVRAAIAAWEAHAELDLSAFDRLTTLGQGFDGFPPPRDVIATMRTLAAQAGIA